MADQSQFHTPMPDVVLPITAFDLITPLAVDGNFQYGGHVWAADPFPPLPQPEDIGEADHQPSRRQALSKADWAPYEDLVRRLYLDEKKKGKEIREILRRDYGLNAKYVK